MGQPSHKNTAVTKVTGGKNVLHSPWPRPYLTVDLVVLTVQDSDLKALLVRRGEAPFRGSWALPGGFVRVGEGLDQGEDLPAAAERELLELTGLARGSHPLEQVGAFGRPYRDPRGRVISVAWLALVSPDRAGGARPGETLEALRWTSLRERPRLAFDHDQILDAGLARLRERLAEGALAFDLVPPTFTVAELRAVYEAVLGAHYDAANFRRRFKRLVEDGVLEVAPGRRQTRSKPAAVYRAHREP